MLLLQQHPPLTQHALDDGGQQFQVLAVHILDQVVLRTALHGLDRDQRVVCAGQHHYRHRELAQVVSQLGQKLQSVHVRQMEVEQHAVRFLLMGEPQPLPAGFGLGEDEFEVCIPRERTAAGHAVHRIVFDYEHADLRFGHCGISLMVQ